MHNNSPKGTDYFSFERLNGGKDWAGVQMKIRVGIADTTQDTEKSR